MDSTDTNKFSPYLKISLLLFTIVTISLYLLYKWSRQSNDDTAPLTKKFVNYLNNIAPSQYANDNNYDTFSTASTPQNIGAKINRFAIDFCRSSPNITHKCPIEKYDKKSKHNYSVNYDTLSVEGKKMILDCVMTVIPLNENILINIEEDYIKNMFQKMIYELSNKNKKFIVPYLHFVILNKQKVMIKIVPKYKSESLREVNSNKKLSSSVLEGIAHDIIHALFSLHKKGIYLLNLHCGNILIDDDTKIKINDIESIIKDNTDTFYDYIYTYYKNKSSYTKLILFEAIDVVSYGRILYEMFTGNELKQHEAKTFSEVDNVCIKEILTKIFPFKGICSVNAKDILHMEPFVQKEKQKSKFNIFGIKKENDSDDDDEENEKLMSNSIEVDNFSSIKDILYNESNLLKRKVKEDEEEDDEVITIDPKI